MPTAPAAVFKLDPTPTAFGRYSLVGRLAVGGMGEIYLARLPAVAGRASLRVVKRLRPELANDPEFASRFRTEARILLQLQHGAITQVHDVGEVDGQSYIALEFVDGKDLGAILARLRARNERLPPALAFHLMSRVLDALAYAHRKKGDDDQDLGLVHRDVSPPNVLVSYEGEVKVIDFGLAKSGFAEKKTDPSLIVGKLLYMAPETRSGGTDRRSDLYSAGVMLHEILSGAHAMSNLSAAELVLRAERPSFPRLEGTVPGLPPGTDALLQRALAVEPAQRFRTADEMRAALAPLLLAADAHAGPEPLGALVRSLFAREYTVERQVLKIARSDDLAPRERVDPTLRSVAFAEVRAVAATAPFPAIDASAHPSLRLGPPLAVDPTFVGRQPSAATEPAMPALAVGAELRRPGRSSTAGDVPWGAADPDAAKRSEELLPWAAPVADQVTDTLRAEDLLGARDADRAGLADTLRPGEVQPAPARAGPLEYVPSPPRLDPPVLGPATRPPSKSQPGAPRPGSLEFVPPAPKSDAAVPASRPPSRSRPAAERPEPAPVPLDRPRRGTTGARPRPPGLAPPAPERAARPTPGPAARSATPPRRTVPWMLLTGVLLGALFALVVVLLIMHRH